MQKQKTCTCAWLRVRRGKSRLSVREDLRITGATLHRGRERSSPGSCDRLWFRWVCKSVRTQRSQRLPGISYAFIGDERNIWLLLSWENSSGCHACPELLWLCTVLRAAGNLWVFKLSLLWIIFIVLTWAGTVWRFTALLLFHSFHVWLPVYLF